MRVRCSGTLSEHQSKALFAQSDTAASTCQGPWRHEIGHVGVILSSCPRGHRTDSPDPGLAHVGQPAVEGDQRKALRAQHSMAQSQHGKEGTLFQPATSMDIYLHTVSAKKVPLSFLRVSVQEWASGAGAGLCWYSTLMCKGPRHTQTHTRLQTGQQWTGNL